MYAEHAAELGQARRFARCRAKGCTPGQALRRALSAHDAAVVKERERRRVATERTTRFILRAGYTDAPAAPALPTSRRPREA